MSGYEVNINDHKTLNVLLSAGLAEVNGQKVPVDQRRKNVFFSQNGSTNAKVFVVGINREEKTVDLKVNGKKAQVRLSTEMDILLRRMGIQAGAASRLSDVKAPMPGLIHTIHVSEGQTISKGDPVIILEAMKMENVIKAAQDAKVARVLVKKGDSVEKGHVLITFEK